MAFSRRRRYPWQIDVVAEVRNRKQLEKLQRAIRSVAGVRNVMRRRGGGDRSVPKR